MAKGALMGQRPPPLFYFFGILVSSLGRITAQSHKLR